MFGGASEVIGKGFSSAFRPLEDTFDGISIPVGDVLESERVTMAGCLQPGCAIEQEDRVLYEMFVSPARNIPVSAWVPVGYSRTCSRRPVSGSTAANSH